MAISQERKLMMLRALEDGTTKTAAELRKSVQLDTTQIAYAMRFMFDEGLVWRGMERRLVNYLGHVQTRRRMCVYRITQAGVDYERRISHKAGTKKSGT